MSGYTAPAYGIGWTAHSVNNVSAQTACIAAGGPQAAYAHPTADLAIYCPVRFKQRVLVRRLFVAILTASGNVDLGLYTADGVKAVSTGTTAAASDLTVDVTDTAVGPGLFYLAFVADNTTVEPIGVAYSAPLLAAYGVLVEQLGTGGTLPATATFAVSQTIVSAPVMAAILDTVIA